MRNFKYILGSIVALLISATTDAQTEVTGDIVTLLNTEINSLPASSPNVYQVPSSADMDRWESIIQDILDEKYADAATKAETIDQELLKITDGDQVYYMLKRSGDVNYWGVYVFNSTACRTNLVIQSPHPIADRNTGKQGAYVFRETGAFAFFLSGTHRCNNTSFSSCSGTTSICARSSEKYKISDVAHNTNSPFQSTTEALKDRMNPYFIQLHGFDKNSNDPYVIMSSGARVLEGSDKLSTLSEQMTTEDNSLTFKISHVDLGWNRLLGFTNTQGRYINNSTNPCRTNALKASGRFMHVEQEYNKLRAGQSQWDTMANGLKNTFTCGEITSVDKQVFHRLTTYPNPTNNTFVFQSDDLIIYQVTISNTIGKHVQSFEMKSKKEIQVADWQKGIYIYQILEQGRLVETGKIIKQ